MNRRQFLMGFGQALIAAAVPAPVWSMLEEKPAPVRRTIVIRAAQLEWEAHTGLFQFSAFFDVGDKFYIRKAIWIKVEDPDLLPRVYFTFDGEMHTLDGEVAYNAQSYYNMEMNRVLGASIAFSDQTPSEMVCGFAGDGLYSGPFEGFKDCTRSMMPGLSMVQSTGHFSEFNNLRFISHDVAPRVEATPHVPTGPRRVHNMLTSTSELRDRWGRFR